jgi:cation diffusion facilitator CzcD-associated flavoprotein CzcO
MSKTKSVAIVGAGASGLVCAKVLLDDGFDVTLFDRQRELGGIWSTETAYADLHTQQPGGTYEFSDLFDGTGKVCHMCSLIIWSSLSICVYFRICFLAESA